MDTEPHPAPDRHALDDDADPQKRCRSGRIGIHNTDMMRIRMIHYIQYIAQGMKERRGIVGLEINTFKKSTKGTDTDADLQNLTTTVT
jgi:hypothetical protein